MGNEHAPTDDIFFDMVSIQYHSMKACEAYDQYIADAHDHEEVASFIRECKEQDQARVMRTHELIKDLAGAKHHANT